MPSTRYQGSKRKILESLYGAIKGSQFHSVLDAFGGTGSVSHLFNQMGAQVTYNDVMPCNATIAKALFAGEPLKLSEADLDSLFAPTSGRVYAAHFTDNYQGIYFTDEENHLLDIVVQNIQHLEDDLRKCEAYYLLFQSALSKRPYNLFHRANLSMRLREVKRNFGNKTTWDKPFLTHMKKFWRELGAYRNSQLHRPITVMNRSAFELIEPRFDAVYIDTPYAKSTNTQESNYFNFYHFLDAILDYKNIPAKIDQKAKHKPYYRNNKAWYDTGNIYDAFQKLFQLFHPSMLFISYRSNGVPSPDDLVEMLKGMYASVGTLELSDYHYVLSTQLKDTKELLITAQ